MTTRFDAWRLAHVIRDAIVNAYPSTSVGVMTLPVGGTMPAVIVQPIGTAEFEGSMESEHEMGMVSIQITCLGKTPEHASGTQAAMLALLVSRTGSSYTTPLAVDGKDALWRVAESLGPVTPGSNVFQTVDTYRFKEMM